MIRRKSTGVKMKDAISKKEWLVLCVYTNVMLCCMEYYIEGGREGDQGREREREMDWKIEEGTLMEGEEGAHGGYL